jgi:hypothetical protein
MKNLQKLFIACAVALMIAVGGNDASAQPDDKWREAVKRRQEDRREAIKRERENWRESQKRKTEFRREFRKHEDEDRREGIKRWQEDRRESRKQEKEYWKEIRKQEKEYRKERRKDFKEQRKESRDWFRKDWRESRRDRQIFPPFVSPDIYAGRRYEGDNYLYNNRYNGARRRYPQVAPRYSDDSPDYYFDESDAFAYLPDDYDTEGTYRGGAGLNWLEQLLGVAAGILSGTGLHQGLLTALPPNGSGYESAQLDPDVYAEGDYLGHAEAYYQP